MNFAQHLGCTPSSHPGHQYLDLNRLAGVLHTRQFRRDDFIGRRDKVCL